MRRENPVEIPDVVKDLTNTELVIDAPNATVSNKEKFKRVTILNIAANTYHEFSENNIAVKAKQSHVVIEPNAKATSLSAEGEGKDSTLELENNGTVDELVADTTGEINVTGTSEQQNIATTVKQQASIHTAMTLIIEALAKASLYLAPGSEGTEVKATDADLRPETFGLGNVKMTVESADGKTIYNITIIVAAQSDEVKGLVNNLTVKGRVVTNAKKGIKGARAYLVPYAEDFDAASFDEDKATDVSRESGEDGSYSFTKVTAGNYNLLVRAPGYADTVQAVYLANTDDAVTYCPDVVLLTEAQKKALAKGGISGQIIDSTKSGTVGLAGITVNVRDGQNNLTGNAVKTAKTDENGNYSISDVPAGTYTVEAVDLNGKFISAYFNVVVKAGAVSANQGTGLSPAVDDGQLRFVMTWEPEGLGIPSDLDSHLVGRVAAQDSERLHVYYAHREWTPNDDGASDADLDRDDTDYEGPETTTIKKMYPGGYAFYVHDYTNAERADSSALSNSGAMVAVYSGSRLVQTFSIPAGVDGTLWKVCTYDPQTNTIMPVNEMSYENDSWYVGSEYGYDDLGVESVDASASELVDFVQFTSNAIVLNTTEALTSENADEVLKAIKVKGQGVSAAFRFNGAGDEGDSAIELVLTDSNSTDEETAERVYNVVNVVDDAPRIKGFKKNAVVTSYNIDESNPLNFNWSSQEQGSNWVELGVKDTELKDYTKHITPILSDSDAEYKIEKNGSYGYTITVKDASGLVKRTYDVSITQDYGNLRILQVQSRSRSITSVERWGDSIEVMGTLDKLEKDDIESLISIVYGSDVANHKFETDEWGNIELIISSDDGRSRSYGVSYSYDYQGLELDDFGYEEPIKDVYTSPDDKTWFVVVDVEGDTPLTDEDLQSIKFEFDEDSTLKAQLKSDADGYYVELVDTADSARPARVYRVRVDYDYPEGFEPEVTYDTSDPTVVTYCWLSMSSNTLEVEGTLKDFADVKDSLTVEEAGGVTSEFVKDAAGKWALVMSNSSGLTRKYAVVYTYDSSRSLDNLDFEPKQSVYPYTGEAVDAGKIGLLEEAEQFTGDPDCVVEYQTYDESAKAYGTASASAPSAVGSYRATVSSKYREGSFSVEYSIAEPNSLALVEVGYSDLYLVAEPLEAPILRDAEFDEIDPSEYAWHIEDAQGKTVAQPNASGDIVPSSLTEPGEYRYVITSAGATYTGTKTVVFEVVDGKDLALAFTDVENRRVPYSEGMEFPELEVTPVGSEDPLAAGSGSYTVEYFMLDADTGDYESCDTPAIGDFYAIARGAKDGYYGTTSPEYFTIEPANSLSVAKVTVKNADIVDDDTAWYVRTELPTGGLGIEIEVELGGKTLVRGTDYTARIVAYDDDEDSEALAVTTHGGYYVMIEPAEDSELEGFNSDTNIRVVDSIAEAVTVDFESWFIPQGSAPSISLSFYGYEGFELGKDYTVAYFAEDNSEITDIAAAPAGTYEAYVVGAGIIAGYKERVTFWIESEDDYSSVDDSDEDAESGDAGDEGAGE